MPVTDLASLRLQRAVLGETGVLSLRVDSEVDVEEEPNSMPNPILFQVLHPHPTSSTCGTGWPLVPARKRIFTSDLRPKTQYNGSIATLCSLILYRVNHNSSSTKLDFVPHNVTVMSTVG